jgi:type IV secretion system protein VirB9
MNFRQLKLASLIALGLVIGQVPAWAQQIATPVNGDTRLVTFDYDPDVTYLILTRPKSVTHLMLSAGEQVVSLVSGDTVNFVFQVSASREHIFIKPKFEGMTTSASLVTSKATYQFILRSANDAGKWHQRVSWNNPDMVLQDVVSSQTQVPPGKIAPATSERSARSPVDGALAIDKLNFSYVITGEEAVKPAQVFDDGVRTYFRMPPGIQELPALFGFKDGEATLVSYNVKDGYFVAAGLGNSYVLKLGKLEAQVQRGEKRKFFDAPINGN